MPPGRPQHPSSAAKHAEAGQCLLERHQQSPGSVQGAPGKADMLHMVEVDEGLDQLTQRAGHHESIQPQMSWVSVTNFCLPGLEMREAESESSFATNVVSLLTHVLININKNEA